MKWVTFILNFLYITLNKKYFNEKLLLTGNNVIITKQKVKIL